MLSAPSDRRNRHRDGSRHPTGSDGGQAGHRCVAPGNGDHRASQCLGKHELDGRPTRPQVLFLDEPTLGLDPQSRRAIWEHIEELKGETTIVLTTHYLEEADALADRIAVIDEGKAVALGTADELKANLLDRSVVVVEADNMSDEAIDALRKAIEGGVEIEAEEVSLYEIEDVLRPRGVVVRSTYQRQVTLDDVFLHLTGKQLRE